MVWCFVCAVRCVQIQNTHRVYAQNASTCAVKTPVCHLGHPLLHPEAGGLYSCKIPAEVFKDQLLHDALTPRASHGPTGRVQFLITPETQEMVAVRYVEETAMAQV